MSSDVGETVVLAGFDARRPYNEPAPSRSAEEREMFLLRPEVTNVLSVSSSIWSSMLDVDPALTRPPGLLGPIQDLWGDLEFLLSCLDEQWGSPWKPCTVIAIGAVFTMENAGLWPHPLEGVNPSRPDSKWHLLGYDVADAWLTSGLSGFGYLPEVEDIHDARAKWGGKLNRFHLFDRYDHADKFRHASDSRVSEHAPFFVFAIWDCKAAG